MKIEIPDEFTDFNRIELAVESGMLVVRLVCRNRFGEEYDMSSSQIPLQALVIK